MVSRREFIFNFGKLAADEGNPPQVHLTTSFREHQRLRCVGCWSFGLYVIHTIAKDCLNEEVIASDKCVMPVINNYL